MARYRDDDKDYDRRDGEDDDDRPRRDRYDDDEDDYRDDRRRRLEETRRRTMGPAIGLIIAGIVGILGNLGWTALNLAVPKPQPRADMPANQRQGYEAGVVVGQFCPAVVGGIFGLLTILGGVGVMKGNRGLAITGCVFGFIPCTPGWLVSLPCGIWALVVLNDPDVRRAFDR